MVEVSGAEALWLLEGAAPGRLVFVQRALTVVRPARHVGEYGQLIVRTPVRVAAVPRTATYHMDEVGAVTGTGRTHGPHDTIPRIHPQTVAGFRLARGTEG